jgi:hypothetical protein
LETLLAVERTNPDGAGIAWLDGKAVRFEKGLTAREAHDGLADVGGPALIHFRFATVGGKLPELCHPFVVAEDSPLATSGRVERVLCHNGHWSDWSNWLPKVALDGPISDTRIIAALVAILGAKVLSELPGRYALLEARGITRYGDWSRHHDGCTYSNLHWLSVAAPRQSAAIHQPVRTRRAPKTHGVWRPSLVEQTLLLLNDR